MSNQLDVHQICKATSVTRTQLNQWITRGYFQPAEEPVNGKARSFTVGEGITLGVFAELIRLGVPHDLAARCSKHLHGFKDEPALLIIYQGPMELIPTSERGEPLPTEKKGLKFYDPAMPPVVGEIIKLSKLSDYAANPDVRSMVVVNIDYVESRVKAKLAADAEG